MGKFKIGIKFDRKLLNSLKENQTSGVEIEKRKHHLSLHPKYLNNFNRSIKELLNEGIAKYNKNLCGILLGFQNIKLPTDIGYINNDSCYIHMDIEADFFVFKPEIGKELQGIVNRRSKDHVGVLVYNAFNVSIPKPQDEEVWLGGSINIGDEVSFRITFINLTSYLPYIRGEIISIISQVEGGTGLDWGAKNQKVNKKIKFDEEPDEHEVSKKTKNCKKIRFDNSDENEDHRTVLKVSKRKTNKILESSTEDAASTKGKKSKKQRREKAKQEDEEVSLQDLNLSELFHDSKLRVSKVEEDTFNEFNTSKTKEKKSKKYKEELIRDEDKDVKSELTETELENTLNELGSKKSKKRKHSTSEAETSIKKHKKN